MDLQGTLAAARVGDQDAFRLLVEPHLPGAYRTALLILLDQELARDAVQEALVRAYGSLGRFRADAPFHPWFSRIVVNEARRLWRRERRQPTLLDELPALPTAAARRRPWALVAAAAVALVVLGLTPLGQKAVVATTEWVMTYTVKVYRGVAPHRSVDLRAIPIGETVDEQGDRIRRVHRGVAVADLTDWPLPTYLGPDPAGKAVVTEAYKLKDGALVATNLTMDWLVPELGTNKMIGLNISRGDVPANRLEEIRSGKEPGVTIYGDKDLKVTQQTVTIKGHEATATLANTTWMLEWWHEGGSAHLYGNIPLEELLKVAESLPTVENVTP